MADEQAARIFRYTGLPVPKQERVAKVYIRAQDIQPAVLESYADKLAATVVTAAMCYGVTKIELHFPGRMAVEIDCDDIKKACAAESGFWPNPAHRAAPPQVSVYELMKLGAHFESYRPQIAVPEQIHAVTGAVSGDEPAAKEA